MSILSSTQSGHNKIIEDYKKLGLNPKLIKFNGDGSIDYQGNVIFDATMIKDHKIPVKFRRVSGGFICVGCSLKSLENAPEYVGDIFDCSYNRLTSLKGGPSVVKGQYRARYNHLKTVAGFPKELGNNTNVYIDNNSLISLQGLPKVIKGSLYCGSNRLKSLKGCPERIDLRFDCSWNQLSTFEKECMPKSMEELIIFGNHLSDKDKKCICDYCFECGMLINNVYV